MDLKCFPSLSTGKGKIIIITRLISPYFPWTSPLLRKGHRVKRTWLFSSICNKGIFTLRISTAGWAVTRAPDHGFKFSPSRTLNIPRKTLFPILLALESNQHLEFMSEVVLSRCYYVNGWTNSSVCVCVCSCTKRGSLIACSAFLPSAPSLLPWRDRSLLSHRRRN